VQKGLSFVNFSIRTKLAVGFGLIFVCLFGVIVAASVAIRALSTMQEQTYKEDVPAMSNLLLLSNNMNKLRTAVQMLILIDDTTVKDREISEINEIVTSTKRIIQELKNRFNNDPETLKVLGQLGQEMRVFEGQNFEEIVHLGTRTKLSDDEKSRLLRQRHGLFKELIGLSSSLNKMPERLASQRRSATLVRQNQLLVTFFAVGGVAFLISVILVMTLDKAIAKPLLALKNATQRIAAGDLDSLNMPFDERADEVGMLNRSFIAMSQALKERSDELAKAILHLQDSNKELSAEVVERQRVEEVMRDSERRTRAILDTAPDGIVTVTAEGIIESVNEAALKMLNYSSDELVSQSVSTIAPDFPSLNKVELPGEADAGDHTVLRSQEMTIVRKDGSSFPVEIASSILNLSDRRITTSILRDVSERKEVERRVSEFYSVVSHELRTPLTSIKGALGLLEGDRGGELSARGLSLVKIARAESDRLIRLINDILDIRKIEAGKLELFLEDLQASSMINASIEGILGLAEAQGIQLKAVPGQPVTFRADRDRIIQVLTNLISNAIKFSPDNGVVTVCYECTPDGVRFSVIDKGKGIPSDQLHKLFGLFQQVDSSDSRPKEGTGLGLAISKSLVEQHGGTIGVDTQPGKGTVFWFELPTVPAIAQLSSNPIGN
jgi:PAS domain S-box-containing protein